ncbi:MAG TPA: DUF1015 domain-containing protein [Elusimicrobiota bacterium]|nr:DUF1015 domain-containing protein [Elusimicrobiota bacterium]
MLKVRPFRGVRFDPRRAPLPQSACPPYDVIPASLQKKLRARPYNAIHLELPAGQGAARYKAAAALWKRWLKDGVLARDERPAFYVVEQGFSIEGRSHKRLGVLTSLGLGGDSARRVLAHERTLSKHKADRTKLISAMGVNVSPVFLVFADPGRAVAKALQAARRSAPIAKGKDAQGVLYTVWRLDDPKAVAGLSRAFAARTLLIADGHHRYSVAREHWLKTRRAGSDGILAYLCPEEDPGLVVYPTHRVLKLDSVVRGRLSAHCSARVVKDLPALEAALAKERSPYAFGLIDGEHLLMRPARGDKGVASGFGTDWLAKRILDGVDPHEIGFHHDAREAAREARSSGRAAFILKHFPVSAIRESVQRAGLLPQKSTYFIPKIGTGLVFRVLDE